MGPTLTVQTTWTDCSFKLIWKRDLADIRKKNEDPQRTQVYPNAGRSGTPGNSLNLDVTDFSAIGEPEEEKCRLTEGP